VRKKKVRGLILDGKKKKGRLRPSGGKDIWDLDATRSRGDLRHLLEGEGRSVVLCRVGGGGKKRRRSAGSSLPEEGKRRKARFTAPAGVCRKDGADLFETFAQSREKKSMPVRSSRRRKRSL